MTIADLRQKLKSGEVSSKELVQEKIERIKTLDTTLNSFLTSRSLKVRLNGFIDELSAESPKKISHSLIRCRRNEPLTS